jgi:hypothetical protein
MQIEAYLRILSDEDTIRAIEEETRLPDASIKELKARRGERGEAMWWNWETPRTLIDIDNPDDGLSALLLAYRPIFTIVRKHHGPQTDVYLEVVSKYEEGEEPKGMYLSTQTIQLLSELGGALDNDVVITLAGKSHKADGT